MSIISGISKLVLSLILVKRIGLMGAALGALIPTTIVCIGFVLPYTMWVIRVHVRDVLKQILIPALIPVIPLSITMYGLKEMVQPASFLSILLLGASGFMIYVLVYLCMETNKFERDIFRSILMNIVNQAKLRLNPSGRSSL
jgi:O-antigen/teichoic acid export membrane protein